MQIARSIKDEVVDHIFEKCVSYGGCPISVIGSLLYPSQLTAGI